MKRLLAAGLLLYAAALYGDQPTLQRILLAEGGSAALFLGSAGWLARLKDKDR
ncbi:hypothetical protein J31TS4_11250 [Paenibacillus sp. J31TS4]|uniref:hypothetical protein n=1 Tax=Paenibacillus sp. J31TS4 TaxID=2807195 RepID=UPI001B04DB66|nr:hypothetical protein [Paenibacillus sp. J31TS4]GIP37845.1 hypothetical protein J31TS4_11250 [Paenibacillus sp. J31TS4]